MSMYAHVYGNLHIQTEVWCRTLSLKMKIKLSLTNEQALISIMGSLFS